MPILQRAVIQDFRNIRLQELSFSPNVNCISGNNGEGKTNLLDAVYYLSMTKSAFSSSDRYNFSYGTSAFSLSGTYQMDNGTSSVFSIKVVSEGEKKLVRDGKPCRRISDHIGILPVVLVSPSDGSLVSESGDDRRRFINSVLSQTDREYLDSIQQYNRLLLQRNSLLKEPGADPALLEVLDARMSVFATKVYEARKRFTESLLPLIEGYYGVLSSGRESVGISYRSDLAKGPLEEVLAASREKDLQMRFTTCGIQRDDFIFTLDGHPIRRCGSQGQQKSFLVALKFAQYDLMKTRFGFPPMLLLDDVFDKLDMGRISNLLTMVAGNDFGQIFITDSNKVRMASFVDKLTRDRKYFEASGGVFKEI